MTHPAISAVMNAQDEIATARDFLELIGMAHRMHNGSSDAKAVHAGAFAAIECLERADALLRQALPALGPLPNT